MGRIIIGLLAKLVLWLAYSGQRAEGLNAVFSLLPARFLAPTLRKHGASIGTGIEMHTPISFHNVSDTLKHHYANLRIGDDCYLGKEVFLDLADKIIIEDRVTISMRVTILTHTHTGKSPLNETRLPPSHASVVLRHGCYVGAGVILLPGIEIGEEAIIGAGAVVTRNVPPGTVVAGVPARQIHNESRL